MSEQAYLDLLRDVLESGVSRDDRTGTGTRSVFGRQIRFDLSNGFPLLTTKKVFLRGIIEELLWFLRGSTNAKELEDLKVNIWKGWGDPQTRELGPVYGHSWRHFGAKPKAANPRQPKLRQGVEITYLGVGNGHGKGKSDLGKTWEGMMARCYDSNSTSYATYGARGVIVCDRWLEFAAFAEDAANLPGFSRDTEARLVLDKDLRGDGFTYAPDQCVWMTDEENMSVKQDTVYTVSKDGTEYHFSNVSRFCAEHGVEAKNFSDLWTGNKNAKVRDGFSFVRAEKIGLGTDQITELVNGLKENPNSRRHIVSAWNPTQIHLMALPPCHCLFQFYVANGKLSCQLYQRSADIFLGVPFNIASYALLTIMLAQQCDLEVGDFVHTFGDVHLYDNHVDQANEQLSRDIRTPPVMTVRKAADIFSYGIDDFVLTEYDPHPTIKADVAI